MAITLVTHSAGACLVTVPSTSGTTNTTSVTTSPLPIPSRFPTKTTPRTAVAPSGHIFLWSDESEVVWEYDSKSRRIGEIVTKSAGIQNVVGLGKVEAKETAVVDDGSALSVWDKDSKGKWARKKIIERRARHVQAISTGQPGVLAVLSEGDLTLHHLAEHTQKMVQLGAALDEEAARHIAIAGSPSRIVIASATNAVDIVIGQDGAHDIESLCKVNNQQAIAGLAVHSSKQGAQAALLKINGAISIYSLGSGRSESALASSGSDTIAVRFLDRDTLFCQGIDGSLTARSVKEAASTPVKLDIAHPATAFHVMPILTTSAKAAATQSVPRSVSHASSTGRASVLGEARNAGNIAPSSSTQSMTKGKVASVESKTARIVSAPSGQQITVPPSSSSRSTSQPVVRRAPRPSSSLASHHTVDPIAEEDDPSPGGQIDVAVADEHSLQLDWALRSPQARRLDDASRATESQDMAEMRREMGLMQLDMLRLGRSMKLEVRKAVEPLMKELAEQREAIMRQQKEIDRLRRGF